MGKVIKIILSVISGVILALIIIPVLLFLLLNISTVQDYTGRVLTSFLSKKLETTVTIDNIRFKLFNRVEVKGIYIEDYTGDTLFYATRLNVPIQTITTRGIGLGQVSLDAPTLNLIQDSVTGTTGMRKLLDHVRGDTTKAKAPFRISAAGVEVSYMNFVSKKLERKNRHYGIDFSDLSFSDIQVRVKNLTILGDSISTSVERVACRERSGFVLNNFVAAEATVTGKIISVTDFAITTPESYVRMNYLTLSSMELDWYREFLDDVSFDADVVDSRIAFSTIAYFGQGLKDWNTVMDNVSLRITGPVKAFEGTIRGLNAGDTYLSGNFKLDGLPDIDRTRFHLDLNNLSTDIADVSGILKNIGIELPYNALITMERLGEVGYAGTLDGLIKDFTVTGQLTTLQGDASVNIGYKNPGNGEVSLNGSLETAHFDLAPVTNLVALGPVSLRAEMGMRIGSEIDLTTTASIRSIKILDYTYHGIDLDGSFKDKDFSGAVHSADPNLSFDFNGNLSFGDSIPEYNFDLALRNADLHRTGFNKRDSVSVLSGTLKANGSGARLDDINGRAVITGATYRNQSDTISIDRIDFYAENNFDQKSAGMYSSVADIELRGVLSYKYMLSYLQNTLTSYLPSLTKREIPEGGEYEDPGESHNISNFYIVNANFKEDTKIAGIFLPGLEISEGTKLAFMFNPQSDYFSLTANSDYIHRGDNFQVAGLSINSRNQVDSISLYVSAEEVLFGNFYLPDLSIVGGAKDNRINVATRFNNSGRGMSALINTVSTLRRDTVTGAPQLRIGFDPSYINSGQERWGITARDIVMEQGKIMFDGFRLFRGDQQFSMDGTASASRDDTVRIVLNNFNLAPLSAITSRQSYFIDGISNGHADISSMFKMPLMYANIDLNSVTVNDAQMPDSRFESYWDFELEQAGFLLYEQAGDDIIMDGYYRPAERLFRANLRFDSLNLALLDPLLPGVIRDSKGTASARVTVASTAGKPVINGNMRINDFTTVVDYTNVPYSIQNSDISINNSIMRLDDAAISDNNGNNGDIRATLNLSNLRNISFDVTVLPRSLQVLGTTLAENDLFYGEVYASDSVNIHGEGNRIRIDVSATTAGQSRFYMNLGDDKGISRADFIVFESPPDSSVTADPPHRLRLAERIAERERAGSRLGIDLSLDVRPNTEVYLVLDPASGDAVRGRGNGNLDIRIDSDNQDDISIYGSYEITEGSYIFNVWNFVTRNFTIEPGSSVHWTGDPMEGQMDIRAVHRVKASLAPLLGSNNQSYTRTTNVDCIINITGSISDPEISFDVVVPNATPEVQTLVAHAMNTEEMKQNQFIWLLAFKSFAAEGSAYESGSAFGAVTGIDFVANQIGAILSSDRFSFMPNVRMRDELSSSEYGGAFYGEIIKGKLYLDVDLMYDSGDNPSVNYRTANSITGDATLSLLLDEAGNFRLQAFSRTIDRFDEYQGMQESGIGIFYRENFDDFADLRRILRERFTRKKKKNRQEESK